MKLLLVALSITACLCTKLEPLPDCQTSPCLLELRAASVSDGATRYRTRGYNGRVPGPTVRTRAGATLRIRLVNALSAKDNLNRGHNENSLPNTTNLHTHGLHVSSNAPADSIFTVVGPGESYDYIYEIPDDHMGGTHWYHPHFHGSTALQAGGGAAGLLIVEDEPGAIPPEVAEMVEVPLLLTIITDKVAELQEEFNGVFWSTEPDDFLLVNGKVAPTLEVDVGAWYRLRIVYNSADNERITFELDQTDTGCEMHLLAKDGVYLPQAPREVVELPLYAGARADAALRCMKSGTAQLRGGDHVALELAITGDGPPAPDLKQFVVRRPCYLADTRDATPGARLDLRVGKWAGAFPANQAARVATVPAGALVEVDAGTLRKHPLHIHINHYQLVNIRAGDANFFQDGDWHDTLLDRAGSATLRFYTDRFAGAMMVHCHNLQHEDNGMMGTVEIEGADGAVFDANCVSKSGFNYTDAKSTSRIGASFCCSSKNDVPLISGLASAGAVVLLCAIAFGVRCARAGRKASAPKRPAEVSDADADPQVKAPDL
mmetsp:Transcript_24556/g.49829  ORF Transcript_24556/g.49829 Transcript_24556/m.49829 type:complete len:546 (+) Transcript_24556:142-1779(+)